MNFNSRITWDKLALEIDLLVAEEPNSLVPLLIGLNAMLWPNEPQEWSYRTLNFMTYEVMALAESYTEQDRLHILNDYFFDQKGFQILPNYDGIAESALLIKPVLSKRMGCGLPVALIYLHLATHLDLPIYPVRLNSMSVLKWVRSGKSNYLDLANAGRILDSTQIIRRLNEKTTPHEDLDASSLDILPSKHVFTYYINELIQVYRKLERPTELLLLFDVLLKLDPAHLSTLKDRALLRQRLGYAKEAMLDIKRYFSYVDQQQAPTELQLAFRQLEALGDLSSLHHHEVLH